MNIAYILIGLGLTAIGLTWWKLRKIPAKADTRAFAEMREAMKPPTLTGSPYLTKPRATPQPSPRHYDKGVVHTVAPATPDREAARRQQQQDDDDAAARRRRQQQNDDDSTISTAITGAIIGEALSGAFDSSSSSSSSIDTGSSIDAGGGSFGGGGDTGSF